MDSIDALMRSQVRVSLRQTLEERLRYCKVRTSCSRGRGEHGASGFRHGARAVRTLWLIALVVHHSPREYLTGNPGFHHWPDCRREIDSAYVPEVRFQNAGLQTQYSIGR